MKFIGLKIFAEFYAFIFSDNRVKLIFIKNWANRVSRSWVGVVFRCLKQMWDFRNLSSHGAYEITPTLAKVQTKLYWSSVIFTSKAIIIFLRVKNFFQPKNPGGNWVPWANILKTVTPVSCLKNKSFISREEKFDLARTRTWNLLLRRQTRYPLRHKACRRSLKV